MNPAKTERVKEENAHTGSLKSERVRISHCITVLVHKQRKT